MPRSRAPGSPPDERRRPRADAAGDRGERDRGPPGHRGNRRGAGPRRTADRRPEDGCHRRPATTSSCTRTRATQGRFRSAPSRRTASSSSRSADQGHGFRPRANEGEVSLGLGLPLIAALSDSFEISGGSGRGSRTTIRFGYSAARGQEQRKAYRRSRRSSRSRSLPGAMVKPVLARVIGVARRARRVLGGPAGGHGAARRCRLGVAAAGDFSDGRVGHLDQATAPAPSTCVSARWWRAAGSA